MTEWLARQDERAVLALAAAVLGLIAAIDARVGGTFSLSIFYLVPVAVGAWFGSRRIGLWLSAWGALLCMGSELASASPVRPVTVVWNGGARFLLLFVVTLLLCELRDRLAREHKLAQTDSLTEVLNRRAFGRALEQEAERARRYHRPISVLYVDLDDFKRVNDTHGHAEGDRLLCEVARLLVASSRSSDSIARLGGDEFAVLCPETDQRAAAAMARKVQADLSGALRGAYGVTLSIGITTFAEVPADLRQLLRDADGSMYIAKRNGKNCIHHTVSAGAPAGAACAAS